MNQAVPLVEMRGIRKSFGAVQALRGVDLSLHHNEVLGLVGDNAAGKSTLMKILSGAYLPDEGEVFVEGQRAQIRQPLNSYIQVTVSVVDVHGVVLGIARTPDAPVFGTDVSLQKARSAMFFSNARAEQDLTLVGLQGYAARLRSFIGPAALGGTFAYANRSIGNISRPFYPDGINGRPNGPLSVSIDRWSPFSTGLQLDLVLRGLVQHVLFLTPGSGQSTDVPVPCANLARLGNGLQIFPGGVPIYRGSRLVGGIGVSGDGIDQDDMVAFLGLARAGQRLSTGIQNAPRTIRADRLSPRGVNLRYVQCPYAPFVGSNAQNVCQGL